MEIPTGKKYQNIGYKLKKGGQKHLDNFRTEIQSLVAQLKSKVSTTNERLFLFRNYRIYSSSFNNGKTETFFQ